MKNLIRSFGIRYLKKWIIEREKIYAVSKSVTYVNDETHSVSFNSKYNCFSAIFNKFIRIIVLQIHRKIKDSRIRNN